MHRRLVVILSLLALSIWLPSAAACPYCDSETGRRVQAGIFNDQFWGNVALTLLPLFILLGIVALIYFDLSWLWRGMNGEKETRAPQPPRGD